MSKWIASADKLPASGVLVFVCDFGQTELSKSFHVAWYVRGEWFSNEIWTRRGEFRPRYWMPIPALPQEQKP